MSRGSSGHSSRQAGTFPAVIPIVITLTHAILWHVPLMMPDVIRFKKQRAVRGPPDGSAPWFLRKFHVGDVTYRSVE